MIGPNPMTAVISRVRAVADSKTAMVVTAILERQRERSNSHAQRHYESSSVHWFRRHRRPVLGRWRLHRRNAVDAAADRAFVSLRRLRGGVARVGGTRSRRGATTPAP